MLEVSKSRLARTTSRVPAGTTSVLLRTAIATVAIGVLAAPTMAAPYTWDTNGSATGTGGSGNWSSSFWTPDGTTFATWPGTGNIAVFGGTAGTVTVGTQTASGLTFGVDGYLLNTGTLTLTSGSVITTSGGSTATFGSALNLAGAAGASITKTGAGTLALNTANGSLGTAASPAAWTVTGGTYNSTSGIFDSILSVSFGSNLGATPTAASTQLILDAGTLKFSGTSLSPAVGATRTFQINAGGGAIVDSNGNPFSNNIVNNAGAATSLYLSNTSGTTTFNGTVSGTGSVTWNGTGALSLQKANSFSGGLTVDKGVVELANTTAAGIGAIIVNNGGELSTLGSQITNAITVNTGGALSWDFFSGSGDYKGPVTLNGAAKVALSNFYGVGAMSGTISGNIGGGGSLATTAANNATSSGSTSYGGTLTVSGANNTYSGGTTVGLGTTLKLAGGSSIGTGGLTNNGTFDLGGNNVTVPTLGGASGNYRFALGSGGTPNKLTVGGAASLNGTIGIAINTAAAGSIAMGTYTIISGAGGLGSSGANVVFAGGQQLNVPAASSIQTIGGTNYRLTLAQSETAVTVSVAAAPAKVLTIMPLGSSITAGQSAQNPYNGGGYRSQLYQDLVNDGRFTPQFVGSSTSTLANNPTGPDLMTTVGQTHHEGHPGYTTTQTLANLNGNDSSGGNNGGNWLATGNGVDPDIITLNIGGNDFVANAGDTTTISRLDQILTSIHQLRPNATIVVSSIVTRTDGNGTYANGISTLYNPLIPGLVYLHTLAGEHVQYLDLASMISASELSSDGVHPTQVTYNKMANAWYDAITTGQAYFTGAQGSVWNAAAGSATSWAMDFGRTVDSGVVPGSGTDVYFNHGGASTTLGQDFAVRSLNFAAGANASVTIGGNNTLTIGGGGITVQAGTAAHRVATNVALATAQTWSNVSTSPFTVSGNVSGTGGLTVGGTGKIVLSGNNTYTGGTTISGGTLVADNAVNATGSGAVAVNAGGTLAGGSNGATGRVDGSVAINSGGKITAGSGATSTDSVGTLVTGAQTWAGGGTYVVKFADTNTADRLSMQSLSLTASTNNKFVISLVDASAAILAFNGHRSFEIASIASGGGTFDTSLFLLDASALSQTNSPNFGLSTGTDSGGDVALYLNVNAAPEPASLTLIGLAGSVVVGRRRRRPVLI